MSLLLSIAIQVSVLHAIGIAQSPVTGWRAELFRSHSYAGIINSVTLAQSASGMSEVKQNSQYVYAPRKASYGKDPTIKQVTHDPESSGLFIVTIEFGQDYANSMEHGKLCMSQGQWAKASTDFEFAYRLTTTKMAGGDQRALLWLADSYLFGGRYGDVFDLLIPWSRLNDDPALNLRIGAAASMAGEKYDGLKEYCWRALNSWSAYLPKADYDAMMPKEDSIRAQAVACFSALAHELSVSDRSENQTYAYRTILELDPGYPIASDGLVYCSSERGKFKQNVAILEAGLPRAVGPLKSIMADDIYDWTYRRDNPR